MNDSKGIADAIAKTDKTKTTLQKEMKSVQQGIETNVGQVTALQEDVTQSKSLWNDIKSKQEQLSSGVNASNDVTAESTQKTQDRFQRLEGILNGGNLRSRYVIGQV